MNTEIVKFPAHKAYAVAAPGVLATLARWLWGEWVPVEVAGIRVACVKTRRRVVEVAVNCGLARVQAEESENTPTAESP
jgi:hypothetical protein